MYTSSQIANSKLFQNDNINTIVSPFFTRCRMLVYVHARPRRLQKKCEGKTKNLCTLWWIVNSLQMVSTEVLCFRCHEGTIKVLCIEWKNLKFGSLKHDWRLELCWQIVHPAASQTFGWSPGIVSVYRAENSFIVRSACFHRAFIELSSRFHRAVIALS